MLAVCIANRNTVSPAGFNGAHVRAQRERQKKPSWPMPLKEVNVMTLKSSLKNLKNWGGRVRFFLYAFLCPLLTSAGGQETLCEGSRNDPETLALTQRPRYTGRIGSFLCCRKKMTMRANE